MCLNGFQVYLCHCSVQFVVFMLPKCHSVLVLINIYCMHTVYCSVFSYLVKAGTPAPVPDLTSRTI